MADKVAVRRLQRGEDGLLHVIYVDAATSQPLTDTTGYTLAEPNGTASLPTLPNPAGGSPSAPTVPQPQQDGGDSGPSPQDIAKQIIESAQNGSDSNVIDSLSSAPRTASNNFGYIDKPTLVSMSKYAPGPLGVAGKMVNGMINSNNTMAVNAARKSMGLSGLNAKDIAMGTLGIADAATGKVADVTIGSQTYTVGLEAATEDGRTTLTPEEARKRAAATTQPLREATPEEAKINSEVPEKMDKQGVFGKVKDAVGGALGLGTSKKGMPETTSQVRETTSYVGEPMGQPEANYQEGPPASKRGGFASLSPSFQSKGKQDPNSFTGVNYVGVDPNDLTPDVRDAIEKTAASVGFGVNVISGARDKEHNAKVGGATNSQHIGGNAVDISIEGLDDGQKSALVGTINGYMSDRTGSIGAYSGGTGLHVDARQHNAAITDQYGGVHPTYDRTINNLDKAPGWFTGGLQNLTPIDRVATPVDRETALATPPDQSVARNVVNQTIDEAAKSKSFRNYGDSLAPGSYNRPGTYDAQTPSEFLGTEDVSSYPAGMRNNNPGNIKHTGSAWQQSAFGGVEGPSVNTDQGDPQISFNSPKAGLDSMSRLAVGKFDDGMTTPNSIIAGPKGWTGGNFDAAKNIATAMGITPDTEMNLRDPKQLASFMSATIQQEHGPQGAKYTGDMIAESVKNALNSYEDINSAPVGKVDRGALGALPSSGFAGSAGSARSRSVGTSNFDTPSSDAFSGGVGFSKTASGMSTRSKDDNVSGSGSNGRTNNSNGFAGSTAKGMSTRSKDDNVSGSGSNGKSNNSNTSGGFSNPSGMSTRSKDDNASGSGSNGKSNNANTSKTSGGFSNPSGMSTRSKDDNASGSGSNSRSSNKNTSASSASKNDSDSKTGGYSQGFGGSNGGIGGSGKKSGGNSTW